jgi:hypothetical protein
LSTHLRLGLPSGLFPSGFPTNILFVLPYPCYVSCPSYPPWLDRFNYTWRKVQVMKLLIMQFSPISGHFMSSSPGSVKNFLFSKSSTPALGSTQPPIQWVPGVLSPGVKQPGREANHSPPASAEVKKMWIYTSTPPYAFMA